jgi:hypothetical protein
MILTFHANPQRRVYFIRQVGAIGPIKIGCSKLPEGRLHSLMAWSPVDLEIVAIIPGDYDLEWNIHDCFALAHIRGEWFRPMPDLVTAVEKIAAGVPVHEAIDLNNRHGSLRSMRRKALKARQAQTLPEPAEVAA